jgi:hypothetical protein
MTTPVRLHLSRAKGFNLQKLSMETNGLPAVNVARPTKWGNPFKVCHPGSALERPMDAKIAVATFRKMLADEGAWFPVPLPWPKGKIPAQLTTVEDIRRELRGHNLACWCKPGQACHADVLLEIANR